MSNNLFQVNNYGQQNEKYSSHEHFEKFAPHLLINKDKINEANKNNEQQMQAIKYNVEQSNEMEEQNKTLFAPTVLLSGHTGEIQCIKFSKDGNILASAGFDQHIYLWDIFNQCQNFSVMKGHKGCILDINFNEDSTKIVSNSSDKTVQIYDTEQGKRIKKLIGHNEQVNSSFVSKKGTEIIASVSDDCSIKIWDCRQKQAAISYNLEYPLTSVVLNNSNDKAYIGSIDNQIKEFNLKQQKIESILLGHMDSITGMSLSHDGSYLLSNSMDQTLRCWDVRPFVIDNQRCLKIFQGHQHNYEKNLLKAAWNHDGSMITAGSSDRFLYIWDTTSKKILHRLSGHNGSVNDVQFSPTHNIVASASTDRNIIIGNIPSYTL